jgi:hypothetical protein
MFGFFKRKSQKSETRHWQFWQPDGRDECRAWINARHQEIHQVRRFYEQKYRNWQLDHGDYEFIMRGLDTLYLIALKGNSLQDPYDDLPFDKSGLEIRKQIWPWATDSVAGEVNKRLANRP